jgi:hypothetical protein
MPFITWTMTLIKLYPSRCVEINQYPQSCNKQECCSHEPKSGVSPGPGIEWVLGLESRVRERSSKADIRSLLQEFLDPSTSLTRGYMLQHFKAPAWH